MTTPHPFAALVRRLDAEASKAPWEHVRLDLQVDDFAAYVASCVEAGPLDEIHAVLCHKADGAADVAHTGNGPMSPENARAIVTLRNAAPEVAALVEAAGAVVTAYDALVGGKPMPSYGSIDALRAALDALARAARDATSGPADPTRIEGSPK